MLVFDGHNDVLSRLWCRNDDPVAAFSLDEGHISAGRARDGGLAGGFFAIYAPTTRAPFDFSSFKLGEDLPLAAPMAEADALIPTIGQAGIARALHAAGLIEIVTDAPALRRSFTEDTLTCLLHLEGADCIGPDLLALDALHALGLRSLGPVWSRPTIFADGVPFKRHSDGDTGGGLTEHGRRLIARCGRLGIMIDTSHMTMRGFWDVAEAGLPLVATHSNAHALAPNARNLTDAQLRAVGETGGMVGLNFAVPFLSDSGWATGHATLDECLRQLDHMIAQAGEDHVALGSDFDGAPLPEGLDHAGDLPDLIAAMRAHGYGEPLITKLCHANWLGFLDTQLETTP